MEKLIQIGDIFEMIWSHSQFLEIMLATSTEVNQSKDDMKGVRAYVCTSNSYTMATRDFADIYTQSPRAVGVCQQNPKQPWYK